MSTKSSKCLEEIEEEWNIERMIHLHVSGISITSALLGFLVDMRWFVLPVAAAAVFGASLNERNGATNSFAEKVRF